VVSTDFNKEKGPQGKKEPERSFRYRREWRSPQRRRIIPTPQEHRFKLSGERDLVEKEEKKGGIERPAPIRN